jgi:hypothetical protein
MKKSFLLAGILFLCFLSYGLTLEIISIERMTKESHAIIQGQVVSSYSSWEGNNIYTYTTIKINEIYKDDHLGNHVTIKQMGGQVGNEGQEVAGTPKLKTNENNILFLTFWKGNYWIHSIALGKFSIIEEEGTLFAENNLNNINLIDPVTKKLIEDPDEKNNKFPLNAFVAQIQEYVRNTK